MVNTYVDRYVNNILQIYHVVVYRTNKNILLQVVLMINVILFGN